MAGLSQGTRWFLKEKHTVFSKIQLFFWHFNEKWFSEEKTAKRMLNENSLGFVKVKWLLQE